MVRLKSVEVNVDVDVDVVSVLCCEPLCVNEEKLPRWMMKELCTKRAIC